MRAGILGTVNFLLARFLEAQAHVRGCKDGGYLADGLGAIGIAFFHERSPLEATHDDVRFAVDAPSGGIIDAGRFRVRSLYTQRTWKMSHSGSAISRRS